MLQKNEFSRSAVAIACEQRRFFPSKINIWSFETVQSAVAVSLHGGQGEVMKVKLAILHNDLLYLNRLAAVLGAKYSDRLALYSFSNPETALESLAKEKIDVFLADDAFEIDPQLLPEKCGFAYFVESPEVCQVKGSPAICQFQRTELLYKQILGLFSETLGETSVRNLYNNRTKVLVFSSPCGGTGTSTLAAACAVHYAATRKRCLYLNLEEFSGADAYFSGEGTSDMSDVIYAVKSKRSSLPLKLESCVKRDQRGVYFFSSAKVALDMMELTAEERVELITALIDSGSYDVLLIDVAFRLEKETRAVFDQAHVLVWVSDGMATSDYKIARAYHALQVLYQNEQGALDERVCLLQNKAVGEALPLRTGPGIRSAGALPKIRHQMEESIVDPLAAFDAFDAILEV